MKTVFVLLVAALALASCAPLSPSQTATFTQAAADLRTTAATLHETAAVLATTPATASAAKATEKAAAVADQGAAVAATATQPGATLIDVGAGAVSAAVPLLPEPYKSYVGLGLSVLAIVQTIRKGNADKATAAATKAATSLATGVQTALATGALVAKPNAAETVDAAFSVDHPVANTVYNALSIAAGNLPPKE